MTLVSLSASQRHPQTKGPNQTRAWSVLSLPLSAPPRARARPLTLYPGTWLLGKASQAGLREANPRITDSEDVCTCSAERVSGSKASYDASIRPALHGLRS